MQKVLITLLLMMGSATLIFANDGEKKPVNTDKSTVVWKGKKVTGAHEGTIQIKSGDLEFDNGDLVGGNFVIDMTTIQTTDLSGNMADKLNGHLTSDDFFGVANHPTATLSFTNVTKTDAGYEITADLTIKETTKPITFTAVLDNGTATADIVVDRTAYDVRYGSGKFFDGLGDKMIYDNFELSVALAY